jgi:Uma2 family endonuclease
MSTDVATRAPAAGPTIAELLLAAQERMELTERGWVEKVTHPAHARMDARLTAALLRLGVSEEHLYLNLRLGPDSKGHRYIPDLVVILPGNPVAPEPHADYAGAPDLIVETLSPDSQDRDWDEKRRAYAARGIPHYWIADPDAQQVTWLSLVEGAYVLQWTRPLATVELPWPAASTGAPAGA